jgi:hypothetical protein
MSIGAEAKFAYGFETGYGRGGTARTFAEIISESFRGTRPLEENPNLSPAGEATEPENLVVNTDGGFVNVPNVATVLRERVHMHGWAERSAELEPDSGIYDWIIRKPDVLDTPLEQHVDSLFFDIWRDDGASQLVLGARMAAMTLNVTENQFVSCDRTVIWQRDTETADPVITSADNFTGRIAVRGHISDPDNPAPVEITVISAGAMDGVTAEIAVARDGHAVAHTAGNGLFPVENEWLELFYSDSEALGIQSENEPFQIMFIPGAPGETLALTDTFEIDPVRGELAPVLATAQDFTAIGAEFEVTLNGITRLYEVHSFSATHLRPMEARMAVGTKYPAHVLPAGDGRRRFTIDLSRDYTDRRLLEAVLRGAVVSSRILCKGGFIGGTQLREEWELISAAMRVGGAGSNVNTPGTLTEDVTLQAFRPKGSATPMLVERVRNQIATL